MRAAENELLMRTGPGTPMGQMLRQYWMPALRSQALERDGPPVRVKLLGQDFVAFRASDGRVGLVDEACPHRGVSLALARNEENGLRCIFHGWKRDVTGKVVDAPCEPAERREAFCRAIRVNQYFVREAANVVWVYLGGGQPAPFPDFEFNDLPADQVMVRRAVLPYNWMQGVEAHLDSSHVPFLHRGFLQQEMGGLDPATREVLARMLDDKSPRFETDETAYGLREAALRNLGDGKTLARIREIVLPFYTFPPGGFEGACHGRISIPIDDDTCAEWYVLYDPAKPLTADVIGAMFANASDDPDNFAANLGNAQTMWGQDRAAMKNGHYSGLTRNLPFEDFTVQASMGRRVDRSKEQLGTADVIIIRVRRMLLDALREHGERKSAPWTSNFDYRQIRARSATYGSPKTWRDFVGRPAGTRSTLSL